MGSNETATVTTGGPRVIDVFDGNGCHRDQIIYFFRWQIGSRTRRGRSGVGWSPTPHAHVLGAPQRALDPKLLGITSSLVSLERFEEAGSLLLQWLPVARRVLGEGNGITIRMSKYYAKTLYQDDGATLDDVRAAVTTIEDTAGTARRVFGDTHPFTRWVEDEVRAARAALDAREAEESQEAERLVALEAVARTAPPQPPPAMSRREQLFARPLTGRSRLDNMVAAGLVEEDDEDAWAADLEEELFS